MLNYDGLKKGTGFNADSLPFQKSTNQHEKNLSHTYCLSFVELIS